MALKTISKVLEGLSQIIFPPVCLSCDCFSEKMLCNDCFSRMFLITEPKCDKCGRPTEYTVDSCRECRSKNFCFSGARSYGKYEGPLRELIHSFKYSGTFNVADFLGREMSLLYDDLSDCVVTFVPMRRSKIAARGYNQSFLLAQKIAKYKDCKLAACLQKTRQTADQNSLDKKTRAKNVKNAFRVKYNKPDIGGKKVLLVDDVFTSGWTANEASKALLKAGASEVHVLTAARATSN